MFRQRNSIRRSTGFWSRRTMAAGASCCRASKASTPLSCNWRRPGKKPGSNPMNRSGFSASRPGASRSRRPRKEIKPMIAAPRWSDHPARWWLIRPDGRVECQLCPRFCKLRDGQPGFCFVRRRVGDRMVLTTHGRSGGFCIDPIEKKPLHHFFPGSSVLSFGTAGCNLACKFCQNWDISKSREMDRLVDQASPEGIARAAKDTGCRSIAFTYNDPVIFAEYAMDAADACHARGVKAVAVTAGYIHPEPRREFFSKMDAANVDL